MSLKDKIKSKATEYFNKFKMSAVFYAEELIGSGNGKIKKEIAIDYLLSKLPLVLKPFVPLFKTLLTEIADFLIEKAVEKLHLAQTSGVTIC